MAEAPVICNSSPLIALAQIGQLPLLEKLFSQIWVPPAVSLEIAPSVVSPAWCHEQELLQPIGPLILSASLGAGESQTLSLALEAKARLVILDERAARRLAQALHLPVIGTLGILIASKRQGYITEVRPCLDDLVRHDFRIAPNLYDQILRDAGE